ncbi:hypothetical protein [Bradyrhizobium sp.]|uniref:hypothetical protein n=1 Tax=Bradyrhizobium sp. TaxID=376 RepID=UPI003C57E7B0
MAGTGPAMTERVDAANAARRQQKSQRPPPPSPRNALRARRDDMIRTSKSLNRNTTGGWRCILAAAFIGIVPMPISAQSAAPTDTALAVPTIKVLAIGSFTAKATANGWKPMLSSEMRQTAQLYLAGKIDQWYVRQDQGGVVFVMNVTTTAEAHDLLDKLPLGVAGFMQFELIPLGPLSPMRTLLSEPRN